MTMCIALTLRNFYTSLECQNIVRKSKDYSLTVANDHVSVYFSTLAISLRNEKNWLRSLWVGFYRNMANLLLGQHSGFTKYPCFLRMWDSRNKEQHYTTKNWSVREELIPCRACNVVKFPSWAAIKFFFHLFISNMASSSSLPRLLIKMEAAWHTCRPTYGRHFQECHWRNWKLASLTVLVFVS